ncbi:hypothetical protein OSC27_03540 [Microbacterium sp. STN6]|uniref:hypothetical protein n=1 Tax=Microbacterium sp. STN6 TaxID=2995588 RepID=UPI0022610465|nr:hypothetical protein [Microbacterium sp. STN6]MCX7521348.1 hypothetical protein [Microbacterium sp. STN6]
MAEIERDEIGRDVRAPEPQGAVQDGAGSDGAVPDGAVPAGAGQDRTVDGALLSRLPLIEEQPLDGRAEAYAQLHEELRSRLEGGDLSKRHG